MFLSLAFPLLKETYYSRPEVNTSFLLKSHMVSVKKGLLKFLSQSLKYKAIISTTARWLRTYAFKVNQP